MFVGNHFPKLEKQDAKILRAVQSNLSKFISYELNRYEGHLLPYLSSYLVATLASLKVYDFTHFQDRARRIQTRKLSHKQISCCIRHAVYLIAAYKSFMCTSQGVRSNSFFNQEEYNKQYSITHGPPVGKKAVGLSSTQSK